MSIGLIGKKIGMTREFMDTGQSERVRCDKSWFFQIEKFKINKTNEGIFCKKKYRAKKNS